MIQLLRTRAQNKILVVPCCLQWILPKNRSSLLMYWRNCEIYWQLQYMIMNRYIGRKKNSKEHNSREIRWVWLELDITKRLRDCNNDQAKLIKLNVAELNYCWPNDLMVMLHIFSTSKDLLFIKDKEKVLQ